MKRLAVAFIAAVIVVAGAIHLSAQNGFQASQFFVDSTPGPLANCPAPQSGHDKICDVAGVGWEQSLQGAAYAPIGGAGSVGPQGPAGPAGAQGPQGIPGPIQSFTKNSCTGWSGGTTGINETGCTQQ